MPIFFTLFLISGFCSLVYEIIWLRLAMATFGVNAPLVSIFLSVFMAGLGIGSLGAGLLAKRFATRNAGFFIRVYALVELLIAISALVVPYLFSLSWALLSGRLGGISWGSLEFYGASAVLVTLIVLPWCVCMGATIPFAMAAVKAYKPASSPRSFSFLYRANVMGAIVGTVAASYVIIELIGLQGALLFTGIINFIIAGTALIYSYRMLISEVDLQAPASAVEIPVRHMYSASYLLLLIFITGLVSMAMEIVWIRMYARFLGTTVYAFASIIAFYLIGTALGTNTYRQTSETLVLALEAPVWALTGLLTLLPISIGFFNLTGHVKIYTGLLVYLLVHLGIITFSAAIGFLTPMLMDRWSGGDPYQAGRAYTVNIVGCIVGPLLAGFVLLPRVSEATTLILLTLPLFLAGLMVAWQRRSDKTGRLSWLTSRSSVAGVVLASLILTLLFLNQPQQEAGVVKRDYEAVVSASGTGMDKLLFVNGISMTRMTPITKFMAHLPLALLPRPPRDSLVICFGMGTTFRSFLSWGIDSTAVDLIPSVPALFGYFHPDAAALVSSPQAKIVVDDGRRFLKRTNRRYDVIAIDPPPPVEAAYSSLLYSKEFYGIAKTRLTPDGILQQWLPRADRETQVAVAHALKESFPYVRVFKSVEGWGFHFLAANCPLTLRPAADLSRLLPAKAQEDLLEWGPYHTVTEQFQKLLDNEISLDGIIGADSQAPVLTDDRPINEYGFLRKVFGKAPKESISADSGLSERDLLRPPPSNGKLKRD